MAESPGPYEATAPIPDTDNRRQTTIAGAGNATDIVAREMQMLGSGEGQQAPAAPRPAAKPAAAGSGFDDMDDDIPW